MGAIRGDEEGEYTYVRKRNTVIDYLIGEEDVRKRVRSLKVGERIESDHQPLELRMKGEEVGGRKGRKGIVKSKSKKGVWNEEGRKEFVERIRDIELKGGKLKEEWEMAENKIKEAMEECEKKVDRKGERRAGWWDAECREKKKEVRRELRRWKNKGGSEGNLKKERQNIRRCVRGKRGKKAKGGKRKRRR